MRGRERESERMRERGGGLCASAVETPFVPREAPKLKVLSLWVLGSASVMRMEGSFDHG